MPLVPRILVTLLLLGVIAFCAFGFLATFEPPGFLGWRIGYAVVAVAGLAGLARVWFATPRR